MLFYVTLHAPIINHQGVGNPYSTQRQRVFRTAGEQVQVKELFCKDCPDTTQKFDHLLYQLLQAKQLAHSASEWWKNPGKRGFMFGR
jgi:hypothetical protein